MWRLVIAKIILLWVILAAHKTLLFMPHTVPPRFFVSGSHP